MIQEQKFGPPRLIDSQRGEVIWKDSSWAQGQPMKRHGDGRAGSYLREPTASRTMRRGRGCDSRAASRSLEKPRERRWEVQNRTATARDIVHDWTAGNSGRRGPIPGLKIRHVEVSSGRWHRMGGNWLTSAFHYGLIQRFMPPFRSPMDYENQSEF